jgi:hypothetical protein
MCMHETSLTFVHVRAIFRNTSLQTTVLRKYPSTLTRTVFCLVRIRVPPFAETLFHGPHIYFEAVLTEHHSYITLFSSRGPLRVSVVAMSTFLVCKTRDIGREVV